MPDTVGGLSSGSFPQQAPIDRSAFGLSIQRDQLAAQARGSALGHGRRTVPDASSLFSGPPPGSSMSQAQFGGGGSAKATFTQTPVGGI